MEIDIKGGLRVKIDEKNKTASIIESPKATGNVLIPRFAEYKNIKYKIISIETNSFWGTEIESVTFPEDSEVETFRNQIFGYSKIKKLRIPPKLKNIDYDWHRLIKNNIEIEISPKNDHFIYYDNKFFLGKSDENSDEFDALYYMRKDIEKVVIPSHIKIIKSGSFLENKKLKSITFTKNSKLKIIERNAFESSGICKLVLPSSIEHIDDGCFRLVYYLTEISILPGNEIFRVIDNKYLLKKSQRKSQNYDFLLFARRDIENVIIPSYIKVINNYAFYNCKQLKSVTFESNSSLELLGFCSFYIASGPEKIVFPPLLKEIGSFSFSENKNIKYIEFLSKSVKIGCQFVSRCDSLLSVSFPNADNIILDRDAIYDISKETKFYVRRDAIISGKDAKEFQNVSMFIEENNERKKKERAKFSYKKEEKSKKTSNEIESEFDEVNLEKRIQEIQKEKKDLERYIFYLKSRLNKFEEIPTIEEFLKNENKYQNDNEIDDECIQSKMKINNEDEQYHKVESKIGEGSTSEVFKMKDTRTGQIFCKKVIKECREEELFQTLKNSIKEIEITHQIRHPCICECLGYNLEEAMKKSGGKEEEEYEESAKGRNKKTTIAIFLEYLPNSAKSLIENKMMNNTLKTRIALEVAFGMKHIHSLGMMHRDLKLENIMLNDIFESKIIDFGLGHGGNLTESVSSLTKGIGTFSYMSPEMLNEEEYDNKTDVYSYGILLFVLFTGRLPKQSMRERLDKVPLKFPKVSTKISEYCIELIKRCTSFKASKRPTFIEIINDMANNSFELASEIDRKAITRRYQELNRFESFK